MKKILLGTSALVLLAGAAAAQQVTTKAPFTVTLGGSIRSEWFFFGDDVANSSSRESRMDYRLNLKAEAKAENGLTYGFDARLRNNQGSGASQDIVGADRKFIYLKGSWGQVEVGDTVSAPTNFEVLSPFIFSTADVLAGSQYGDYALYFPNEGTFDTKINYYTPVFAGFQAGVSYTPEYNSRGRDNARSKFVSGAGNNYKDIISLGAGYTNKFGDVGLKVGAGYETGETKETSATVNNTAGDMQVWNVGAQLSYSGFTFGAHYYDAGATNLAKSDDRTGWQVGLTYAVGPWGVGIQYSVTDINYSVRTKRDASDSIISLGGGYTIAPGLNIQADVAMLSIESATGLKAGKTKNDGTQFTVRTRLDF